MASTGTPGCTSAARWWGVSWRWWRARCWRIDSYEAPMTHRFKGDRTLKRIFIGESDKDQGKTLYDGFVERLRAKGLAGPTDLRGLAGLRRREHWAPRQDL